MTQPKKRPVEFSPERPKKRENPRTTQMGNFHAPRAVLYDGRLNNTTRLVACWLYDHMRPGDHVATGAIATIAQDLKIGTNSVQRAIKELAKFRIILTISQELNNHKVPFNQYRMRIYDEGAKKLALVKPKAAPASPPPVRKPDPVPAPESYKRMPKTINGVCAACRGRGLVYAGRPPKEVPCPMCAEPV
jgi:hypothetical protein